MAFFFLKRKEPVKAKEKNNQNKNKIKLGLALGGGGARGFAHIGVLRAFEEAGIEFDLVSGTSVGSIVGAGYCFGLTSEQLADIGSDLEIKDIRNKSLLIGNDANNIGKIIKQSMGDITFKNLNKPLYVVAVDLKTSSEIVLESGSVANAVSASCAVPVIFRPVVKGNFHLVDGGVLNNIPSDVLRVRGADKVVAVDINSSRNEGTDSLNRLNVISATFRIMMANSSVKGLMQSDVVIRPDTKRFSAAKKTGLEEMIEEGYLAAKEHIEEIKGLLLTDKK